MKLADDRKKAFMQALKKKQIDDLIQQEIIQQNIEKERNKNLIKKQKLQEKIYIDSKKGEILESFKNNLKLEQERIRKEIDLAKVEDLVKLKGQPSAILE